jgi:myo-inositol-1(or 4)-monophosphatase
MLDVSQRFLAACAIAREAGAMAKSAFRSRTAESSIKFKGPQDYLTESDAKVELLIRDRLANAFPDDGFLGEETGSKPRDDTPTWVVDPIDGTANFARGIPHFCVALGVVSNGRTEIGVIYNPMADELFAAMRGKGATLDGAPIHVSATADLHAATIEIGWSSRIAVDPYIELVRRVKKGGANVRRAGSGALALAYVAAGRNDGYSELHI